MTTPYSFTITQPTEIHFGAGMIQSLAQVIVKLGGSKPLLVIDPGLVRAGLDNQVTGPLTEAGTGYAVFNSVAPEPGLH